MTISTAALAASPSAALAPIANRAREFILAAKAPATLRAYRSDWRDFEGWCSARGLTALPAEPETIALYLAERAESLKPATLTRRLAAISKAHAAARHDSPASLRHAVVSEVLKGIRRTKGTAPACKAPLLVGQLKAALRDAREDLLGTRDRALLLVGFAGAFRRSELVSLDVADIAFTDDGLVITLRRSKTDQEAEGRKIGIPHGSKHTTCPVRALRAWLEAAGILDGPAFRSVNRHGKVGSERLSGRAVAIVVKRAAELAGLEPEAFAGHSLRAGLATSAAAAGASERSIMDQTGHRSVQMVRRYIRDGSLFRDNAAGQVGL
jgi:integrase